MIFFFFPHSEHLEIKYSAIDALYKKHDEHKVHRFTEEHREKHITNWTLVLTFMIKIASILFRVTQYAEEQVAYGTNYFLKVSIDDGLFIHIRIHRRKNQNNYHFYALHEIIRHNNATCIFTEGKNASP